MKRLPDYKLIKQINSTAYPLILSSIVSVLMGWIDQAFIGHISVYAYAGVGLVLSCVNSLVGVLGAFSIVFNIYGSKLWGKQEEKKLSELFSVFIIICLIIGIILSVFFNLYCDVILSNGFGLEGRALTEASIYLKVYSFSIPLNLLIFIHSSVIKIYKKTQYLFVCVIIVNIINIILDYALVFGKFFFPELGTLGAALGTIIALIVNLLIYICIVHKFIHFSFFIDNLKQKMQNILKYSLPFIGQEAMEDIVFVVGINSIVARVGVLELSAYNLILQIINFFLMPMFGYATANTIFVGENYAQKKYKKIYKVTRYTIYILAFWFTVLFLLLNFSSTEIARMITQSSAVKSLSVMVLPIALMAQLFNYYQNICKSTLQCIGFEKWTLLVTFVTNIFTLLIILLFGKNLSYIYIIMGAGYLVISLIYTRRLLLLRHEQFMINDQ